MDCPRCGSPINTSTIASGAVILSCGAWTCRFAVMHCPHDPTPDDRTIAAAFKTILFSAPAPTADERARALALAERIAARRK